MGVSLLIINNRLMTLVQKALMQVFFHHGVDDFLCNGIPQGVGNRAAADPNFGGNVLFLPTLEVKIDDLHVYRLQGLQGDVVSRWH